MPTSPMVSTRIAASVSISVKPRCRFGLWCDIDVPITGYRHRFRCGTVRQSKSRRARRCLHVAAWSELQRDVLIESYSCGSEGDCGAYVSERRRARVSRRCLAANLKSICRLVECDVVKTPVKNRSIASRLNCAGDTGSRGADPEILNCGSHGGHRQCGKDDANGERHGQFNKRKSRASIRADAARV